jgi:hypothetical protein
VDILSTLDKARQAAGRPDTDFGPGYQYLRSVASVLNNYGGQPYLGRPQTRQQYMTYLGAMDPLLAQSQSSGALGAFGPTARAIATPFFTNGLRDVTKLDDGRTLFGRANSALY